MSCLISRYSSRFNFSYTRKDNKRPEKHCKGSMTYIEISRKEIIHMTKATDNETANVGNTSLIWSIVGYRIKPAE